MSRIGRAIIEVLLKTEQAKSQVQDIKKEIASIDKGSTVGASSGFDELRAEFAKTGQSIAKLKEDAAAVAPAVGGVQAAASGLLGVLGRLAWPAAFFVGVHELDVYLDELHKKAVALKNALTDAQDPGLDRISAIREEIRGVSELEKRRGALNRAAQENEQKARDAVRKANGGDEPLTGSLAEQREEAIRKIRENNAKALEALDELYAKQEERRTLDADSKFYNQSKTNSDRLTESALSGLDRIDQREQRQLEDLAKRRRTLADDAAKSQADREEQAIRAAAEADREQERQREIDQIARELEAGVRKAEADARDERRQKEAAERVAKHAADVWRREMEQATKALYTALERATSSQQSALNSSLSRITSDMTRLYSLIDMRMKASGIDTRRSQ